MKGNNNKFFQALQFYSLTMFLCMALIAHFQCKSFQLGFRGQLNVVSKLNKNVVLNLVKFFCSKQLIGL